MTHPLAEHAENSSVKSLCQACGEATRGRGDMLCAACWTKAPRELVNAWRKTWSDVHFAGLPESALESATVRLIIAIRGHGTMNTTTPTKTATRTCAECARDFEYVPGLGRPPLRCLPCRSGSAPVKEPSVKLVRATPHKIVRPPARTEMPTVDVDGIRATIRAELERIERQVVARKQLLDALEVYEAQA